MINLLMITMLHFLNRKLIFLKKKKKKLKWKLLEICTLEQTEAEV